jgi:hypothetical protein
MMISENENWRDRNAFFAGEMKLAKRLLVSTAGTNQKRGTRELQKPDRAIAQVTEEKLSRGCNALH